jgi:hypothetical protein
VPPQAATLLLPAINDVFDIATTREMATRNHPPIAVFLLLSGASLAGALLVGYSTSLNKKRSWIHIVAFAATLALTVFVIADLEFPRLGLIRVDSADEILVEVARGMR